MDARKIIDKALASGETIAWQENVENNQGLSFQVVVTSLGGTDGYIDVSQSLDNSNWEVLRKFYLNGETSPINFSIDEYCGKWLRVRVVSSTNTATNIKVYLADGGVFVAPLGIRKKSVEFTRPATETPYTVGAVVGNAGATAIKLLGVVKKPGGSGRIIGLMVMKNNATVTNNSYRLHLYSNVPTVIADNAAMTLLYANVAGRIAKRDFTLETEATGSNAAYAELQDVNIPFKCDEGSTDITCVLQAKAAMTPASGTKFTIVALIDEL